MIRINTFEELHAAIEAKKSVVVPSARCFAKPRPAAFTFNYSGGLLWNLLQAGMFIYEKPAKEEQP